jgi:hypothetical protein
MVVGVLVVVTQEMQQTMKREDAQLGGIGVPGLPRLAASHAGRNHDVAEKRWFVARGADLACGLGRK